MDGFPGDPWIWGWAFFTALAACVGIWMLKRGKDRADRHDRLVQGARDGR